MISTAVVQNNNSLPNAQTASLVWPVNCSREQIHSR